MKPHAAKPSENVLEAYRKAYALAIGYLSPVELRELAKRIKAIRGKRGP